MNNKLTESKITQALDWAYEKAINGVTGLDSASEMAQNYTKTNESTIDNVNSLIRWQNTKAATSGFLSGLGGIVAMPVTIPANIASVMYIQIRMIAAIAQMGGHDIRNDKVKTLVIACLAGDAVKDILKDAGLLIGTKIAHKAINNISGKTISMINQKVGFRLVTKFGETGVANLGKMVPFLGGIISGTLDATTTNTIGNIARKTFIEGVID